MTAISKNLVGILFGGAAAQVLASAAWKGNLNAVYGFTSAGTGYQVFKPGNSFNSLTQLVPDGMYILDVRVPGFELPGALLAVPPAPAVIVSDLSMRLKPNGFLTITSNVQGADTLRLGSLVVALTGVEQHIDTDPTDKSFEAMADDGYVYLEYLKDGVVVLNYPFPTRFVESSGE